jgi:class 3 adenylate cyclase/tetratricopeptide (TPR) repeat protein
LKVWPMALRAPLPSGTVTLLFTDIEGSTQHWEERPNEMSAALRRHDELLRIAIEAHGGHVFKTMGDQFCAAFSRASDAVAGAAEAQRALAAEDWSAVGGLQVRMALHSGATDERDGDYFGPAVNRVARLMAAAAGGQVLLSHSSAELLTSENISLRDLGEHRLKGLDEAERVFQLLADGLPSDFPPLRSMDAEEIQPTPGFTGRDQDLRAVAAALDGNDAIAAIHGLGGAGKSTLAREYAWRNRDRYALTWWFNAQTESAIIDGLVRLGALFVKGLDQLADRRAAARQVIRSTLSGFTKPVLLIFDNLEDERLLRTWQPKTSSHLLATSRNTAWSADVSAIALDVWPVETAVGYLQRESGRVDLTEAEARAIAEALGSLPLAMSHAAASLRGMRTVAPQRYLQRIGEHLKNAPDDAEYPRSVFATFSTSIAQAEYQAAGAGAVLCFAASFAPDAIPDELFRQPIDRYPDGLRPEIPGRGDALGLRSAVADDLRLDGCLGALDRLSLLAFGTTSRTYSLHRLVQFAARDLAVADAVAWRECAVGVADAAFPVVEFATWPQCERLLLHARAALDALSGDVSFLPTAHLAVGCAVYLWRRGDYGAAVPLLKRALAILEKALGADHPDVARCLSNLATIYRNQARYAEAESLFIRALAILERSLGPDHPDIARRLSNLATIYRNQARYAEAESLFIRALAILERSLGPDHEDVAIPLNSLANVYYDQGRYADAEPMFLRALAISEKALGPDDPAVAHALNNLANVYRDQSRYAEAEPLYTRALAIREKALGPDHPFVATSLNSLANVYRDQTRYAEAEPLHTRALAIREKALGPDHPDVAYSLNSLAVVYWNQGRYAEAEALLTRALSIFEKALPPDHPDVAESLNSLANVYHRQGRHAEAEPLYMRALTIREKVLGLAHAFTKATRENLSALRSK